MPADWSVGHSFDKRVTKKESFTNGLEAEEALLGPLFDIDAFPECRPLPRDWNPGDMPCGMQHIGNTRRTLAMPPV